MLFTTSYNRNNSFSLVQSDSSPSIATAVASSVFFYTAKVATNTVHKSTYNAPRYIVYIHYLQMLIVTFPIYNTLCYILINITDTTLTAYIILRYITLHNITLQYTTLLATYIAYTPLLAYKHVTPYVNL